MNRITKSWYNFSMKSFKGYTPKETDRYIRCLKRFHRDFILALVGFIVLSKYTGYVPPISVTHLSWIITAFYVLCVFSIHSAMVNHHFKDHEEW